MGEILRNLAIGVSCTTQAVGGIFLSVLATILNVALPQLQTRSDTHSRPLYVHASHSADSNLSGGTRSSTATISSTSSSSLPSPQQLSHSHPNDIRPSPLAPSKLEDSSRAQPSRSRPSIPPLSDRALKFTRPQPASFPSRPLPPPPADIRIRQTLTIKPAEQVQALLTPIDETTVAHPKPTHTRQGSSSSSSFHVPHLGKRSASMPSSSSSVDGGDVALPPKRHLRLCRSVSLPSKHQWSKDRSSRENSQVMSIHSTSSLLDEQSTPTEATVEESAEVAAPKPGKKSAPRRCRSLCTSHLQAPLEHDASPKKPLSRPPKPSRKSSASSVMSQCTADRISTPVPSPPVARTRPYEAPYYFPSPASPEARNYVENTRQVMRRASRDMYSASTNNNANNSSSPSASGSAPIPILRGGAQLVSTPPLVSSPVSSAFINSSPTSMSEKSMGQEQLGDYVSAGMSPSKVTFADRMHSAPVDKEVRSGGSAKEKTRRETGLQLRSRSKSSRAAASVS